MEAKVLNMEKDVHQIKIFLMENRAFRDQENIVQLDKIKEVYDAVLPISNYMMISKTSTYVFLYFFVNLVFQKMNK